MPKPYPPEFRRRALDLLESRQSVPDEAAALGNRAVLPVTHHSVTVRTTTSQYS